MATLTTQDAEIIYHIPGETFAQWCRESRLPATKVGGEWQIAIPDIDAFLTANPALRPVTAQSENRAWVTFGAIAAVLGFVVDAVALRDIIRGGDRTVLWILAGLLSLALWSTALVLLRPRLRKGRPFRLTVQPRFTSRPLLVAARVVAVGMPLMLVLGVVGYNVWRVIPPQQTVVLVADFRDPNGVDSARVTQSLVDGIRETLKEHSDIKIKRLSQFIPAEGGSERARALGKRPEHKAAFVIWGDYTLEPNPELHVHFDILTEVRTCFCGDVTETYGPGQIEQPTMFGFKQSLSNYLGELTAFASGLALFNAGEHLKAVPLFDKAARAVGTPLAVRIERAIRFYRGTNFGIMGRTTDARKDLEPLVLAQDGSVSAPLDELSLSALGNLALVVRDQGDFVTAKGYLAECSDAISAIESPPGPG